MDSEAIFFFFFLPLLPSFYGRAIPIYKDVNGSDTRSGVQFINTTYVIV